MASRDRPTRSERLRRLVDIAGAEERRAASVVGRLNAELRSKQAQLTELDTFRRDYAAGSGGLSGSHSAHWKDYREFLGRLDAAIHAQRQVVHDAEQGIAAARQRWMAKRQRLDSLSKIEDRARVEEDLGRDRREQRAADDLARAGSPFESE